MSTTGRTIFWRLAAGLVLTLAGAAQAAIQGETGTAFTFTAKADYISTADGNSIYMWGYSSGTGRMQYPGPTLIVDQGATITVTLTNGLPDPAANPVSIVFPGQGGVTATGGAAGALTRESTGPGDAVTYSFVARHPGTYWYHSGSRPELQVEMGLMGALIVRPTGFNTTDHKWAYDHPDTAYDREYLFFLSEIDPDIHKAVETGAMATVDNTRYAPTLWFMNGRNLPDDLFGDFVPWLPTQPYGALVRMHPGERILKRVIGASRDLHPHHPHGNNITIFARDGRLLSSAP